MAPIDGFTPPGEPVVRRRSRLAAAPRGGDGRRRRAARRDRPRGGRARRLRQGGELARTPGRAAGAASSRATRELEGYSGSELPHVDRVGQWLEDHRPAQCPHRDHPRRLPVRQRDVLAPRSRSWRRSSTGSSRTLGDPLLDLAWMLTAWHEPDDPPGHGRRRRSVLGPHAEPPGGDRALRDGQRPLGRRHAVVLRARLLQARHPARRVRTPGRSAGQAPMEMGLMLHSYATWLFQKGAQTIAA